MRTFCAGVGLATLTCVPCWEIRCFGSVACRHGQLAQLVRALRSHRRGHRFESCAAHSVIDSCFEEQIASRLSPRVQAESANRCSLPSATRPFASGSCDRGILAGFYEPCFGSVPRKLSRGPLSLGGGGLSSSVPWHLSNTPLIRKLSPAMMPESFPGDGWGENRPAVISQ